MYGREVISIPKRVCAVDGELKEVRGGRECENGHFVCASHMKLGFSHRTQCPLCKKRLR